MKEERSAYIKKKWRTTDLNQTDLCSGVLQSSGWLCVQLADVQVGVLDCTCTSLVLCCMPVHLGSAGPDCCDVISPALINTPVCLTASLLAEQSRVSAR